jgi:hypothetical protein
MVLRRLSSSYSQCQYFVIICLFGYGNTVPAKRHIVAVGNKDNKFVQQFKSVHVILTELQCLVPAGKVDLIWHFQHNRNLRSIPGILYIGLSDQRQFGAYRDIQRARKACPRRSHYIHESMSSKKRIWDWLRVGKGKIE